MCWNPFFSSSLYRNLARFPNGLYDPFTTLSSSRDIIVTNNTLYTVARVCRSTLGPTPRRGVCAVHIWNTPFFSRQNTVCARTVCTDYRVTPIVLRKPSDHFYRRRYATRPLLCGCYTTATARVIIDRSGVGPPRCRRCADSVAKPIISGPTRTGNNKTRREIKSEPCVRNHAVVGSEWSKTPRRHVEIVLFTFRKCPVTLSFYSSVWKKNKNESTVNVLRAKSV